MLQLYYSFVFPYLHYCNLAWGNTHDTTLWPIYRNQKIALRIISNTPRRCSTIDFCKKFGILRLPQIYQNSVGLFMFKYTNGLLPDIFVNFFTRNQFYHSHNTRNAAQLRTPLTKTISATKFIKFTGVASWNLLEHSITTTIKIGSFKKLLKKFIINS